MGDPATDPLTGVRLPPYTAETNLIAYNVLEHFSSSELDTASHQASRVMNTAAH